MSSIHLNTPQIKLAQKNKVDLFLCRIHHFPEHMKSKTFYEMRILKMSSLLACWLTFASCTSTSASISTTNKYTTAYQHIIHSDELLLFARESSRDTLFSVDQVGISSFTIPEVYWVLDANCEFSTSYSDQDLSASRERRAMFEQMEIKELRKVNRHPKPKYIVFFSNPCGKKIIAHVLSNNDLLDPTEYGTIVIDNSVSLTYLFSFDETGKISWVKSFFVETEW